MGTDPLSRSGARPGARGAVGIHNGRVTEPLFTIPLWADLTAVGLGGIQGALFASGFQGERRLDLLGVAIIGIVMGMGGGLIRDLLLNAQLATLQNDWYLLTATVAALHRHAAARASSSGSTAPSSRWTPS